MGKYDLDFHAWAAEQAELARRRSANEIDWDNVAEELDGLSKQQVAELRNRYVILLAHLLKWRFHPERRSASWSGSIGEQRVQIDLHIADNPSLKHSDAKTFERAYAVANVGPQRKCGRRLASSPRSRPSRRSRRATTTSGPRRSQADGQI